MNDSINQTITTFANSPVEIGRNYLAIPENATDSQLTAIGAGLREIEGSNLFWVGDYLLALENRKGEHYAKAHETAHYKNAQLHKAKYVCRHLPPDVRTALSFSHHKEALAETGTDPAKAVEYLSQAAQDSLTVSQMRKRIRLELNPPAEAEKVNPMDDKRTEFLMVMDALKTIERLLMKLDSETVTFIKEYLLARIEGLHETARAICK